MLETFIESFCIFLAAGAGIYSYKYLTPFYQLLLLQILIYLAVYIGIRTIHHFNHFLYNIGTFLEIGLLTLAAHIYFRDKQIRNYILLLFACYLTVYLLFILHDGLFLFAHWSYVTGGIGITLIYLLILYRGFIDELSLCERKALICASLGLIIYFACNVPNLSMVGYLNSHLSASALKIFNLLVNSSSNIRYFLTAYAFLCLRKGSKQTATLLHE